MNRMIVASLALAVAATAPASAQDVLVKKAIADRMSPSELAAYKERLAKNLQNARPAPRAPGIETPGDTCTAATFEIGTLPFGPAADTTIGAADDFDLPADTTNPTCTASTLCTGGGPAGAAPRGGIYTGTGTGPDRAFRIRVSAACTLTVNMDPTSTQDLALIVYQTQCTNSLADCVCVDDDGVGGAAESVSLQAVTGLDYFLVTDGYSSGGVPPGPSGPYTMAITGAGCTLVPVELLEFNIS